MPLCINAYYRLFVHIETSGGVHAYCAFLFLPVCVCVLGHRKNSDLCCRLWEVVSFRPPFPHLKNPLATFLTSLFWQFK